MIPKIIHYCWFGKKPKNRLIKKCIASWHKYCPDYKFIEWNEDNFDIYKYKYVIQAYEKRKWAFVSDVVRLYALNHYGGVYLDTDVELVKPLDPLLQNKAFLGFEGNKWIATNIMGSEANNIILLNFFNRYMERNFYLGSPSNVVILTNLLVENYNLILNGNQQNLQNMKIYPTEYFCPYDYINGKLNTTDKTFSIHWYDMSWSDRHWLIRKISLLYHRLLKKGME